MPQKTYSYFVRSLKVFLPLVVLGLIGIVIIRYGDDTDLALPENASGDLAVERGKIAVTTARFEGLDAQKRPYVIMAQKASKPLSNDETVIDLASPEATLHLDDARTLGMRADEGTYDLKSGALELTGSVTVTQNDTHSLTMQNADVDLKNGTAISRAPVSGEGPGMRINGSGMEIKDSGNVIVVGGPAKITYVRTPAADPHTKGSMTP